jgi:hypothetical protein
MASRLHQLRSRSRSLRWPLTLSYTQVTAGTLLVLALLLAGDVISCVYLPADVLQPRYWIQTVQ